MGLLDGAICVGKFEESLLRKHYSGPIRRVDVFIEKKFHEKLLALNPKLIGKKVLFIGNGPDTYYKGIDLLIEVAKENPNIKFMVIGGSFEKFLVENLIPKNVIFTGRLEMNSDEMGERIKNSSLYVHLGRGEAFGITILEAMAAGLPCIVSELTGAKEVVEKIDQSFIVPLDRGQISQRILQYFENSLMKRRNLSKKFKDQSKFYNEEKQLLNFRNQFENLMGDVYGD